MEFEERNPIIASLLSANEEKDQQIAVLEKALELVFAEYNIGCCEQGILAYSLDSFKQQADKELGDKE